MFLLATLALAAAQPCATPAQQVFIQDYYGNKRPGVPLAVASRYYEVPEMTVASGLPVDQSFGVAANPELVQSIWTSIDNWGADTKVSLVLSPSSEHAFAFPSLVPITQPDPKPGYLDVYADGGKGVHSHIHLARVGSIFATDIPSDKPGFRTRAISFFGHDGHLVIGVYASIKNDAPDAKAVAGFEKTKALVAGLPRVCR